MEDILNNKKLKENPFGVPNGYFKDLETQVMCSISSDKNLQKAIPEKRNVFTLLKPAFSMAAMFAIIFGLGWGVMQLTNLSSINYSPDSIFTEQELSEDDFISLIGNSIYQEHTYLLESTENKIDNEVIENYLIDSRTNSYTTLALLE